jgi:hypothetical protein
MLGTLKKFIEIVWDEYEFCILFIGMLIVGIPAALICLYVFLMAAQFAVDNPIIVAVLVALGSIALFTYCVYSACKELYRI